MSTEINNIYEKLANITNEIKTVNKSLEVGSGKNKYKAVSEADVLSAVKELENKYKVYSYPVSRKVIDSNVLQIEREYDDKVIKGNQIFLRLEIIYRFVNIEKPEEFVEITSYGDGVDTQDKAPGKAMTYADKYALMKAYKIVTGDDPDAEPSPGLEVEDAENVTKEDAENYILNFGAHKGEKLIDIFNDDFQYLEWLIKNKKATPTLERCIQLLKDAENDRKKLELLAEIEKLEIETNSDHQMILDYFKVTSNKDMTKEQLNECIKILKKKGKKNKDSASEVTPYDF